MLGTGPRFARDAFGPVLIFYVGWRLVGFRTGVIAATLVAVSAYAWERRHGRRGLAIGVGLFIALVQAGVRPATGSSLADLAPCLTLNVGFGLRVPRSVP